MIVFPVSFIKTSGLVLHYDPSNPLSYPGSGTTLTDLTGNALNATLSNITYTSPHLTFNGTSSTTSTADNQLLEPGTGDWTVEVWINHSVITGSSRCVMSKTNGGNASDWGYGIRTNSDGNTYFEVGNGTTSVTSPGSVLSVNTWYQVVGVWTNIASNSIALYINGTLIGSNSHSFASIRDTTRPLALGSFDGGATFGQWVNGKYGIVRIYNRALTATEVSNNYTTTKIIYESNFSQAFVQGVAPTTTVETAWNTFRASLTGTYTSFTWSSTNGNTLTVTDPTKVQILANSLRTATITSQIIGANTWLVGTGCGTPKIGGVAVEFSNVGSCNAGSTYALRPMINNANWGGTNQSTVNAPSQTITLTFF
jgi:hypothetical protein